MRRLFALFGRAVIAAADATYPISTGPVDPIDRHYLTASAVLWPDADYLPREGC